MRVCHHCGKDIGKLERVGRRNTCLHCGADLHCCLNCEFYEPNHNNQCRESDAERQVDKSVGNFCDYFSYRSGLPKAGGGSTQASVKAKLDALFAKKKEKPGS